MLLRIDAIQLGQRCDSCGKSRVIPLASLVAGVEFGDPPEPLTPHIIVLPVCSICGSQEFLNRVLSGIENENGFSQHRMAVNAVHAWLVSSGRVPPTLRDYFAAERIETQTATLPWSFPGEPVPIGGELDAGAAAFADFLARRRQGCP